MCKLCNSDNKKWKASNKINKKYIEITNIFKDYVEDNFCKQCVISCAYQKIHSTDMWVLARLYSKYTTSKQKYESNKFRKKYFKKPRSEETIRKAKEYNSKLDRSKVNETARKHYWKRKENDNINIRCA